MVLLNADGKKREGRYFPCITNAARRKTTRERERLTQRDGPDSVVGERRFLVPFRVSIVVDVVAVVLQQFVQPLPEVLGGHAADCRVVVLIPHERLGGEVALRRHAHLLLRAGDALLLQIDLEPVVLVPAYEEPHVGLAVQLLMIELAEHPPRGHHVEQADDYPRVLTP